MRTTQALSITLPRTMADMVKAKVASGEYASDSEVIRDGLRMLSARDVAVEKWLKEEVTSTYDAIEANSSLALNAEDADEALDALMTKAEAAHSAR
jgi:antitoxin ParD1/3/4